MTVTHGSLLRVGLCCALAILAAPWDHSYDRVHSGAPHALPVSRQRGTIQMVVDLATVISFIANKTRQDRNPFHSQG